MWIGDATFDAGCPIGRDRRPMNEVGGGFKHATPGQIACRDKLPAMLLNLGRSLRL